MSEKEKIRVLVADDVPQTRTDIKRLLYFEEDLEVVGEASNGKEALEVVTEHNPDVVLMDINMPVMDGIEATQELALSHPHVSVIIISIQGEQEYLKKSMVAGARDYLVKPLSSDEMASTIRQVYQLEKRRNRAKGSLAEPRSASETGAARSRYQTISFFSGKGGTGKTFLACNLAAVLAQQQLKVVLLDLDLQFGDVSVMFNINGSRSIGDLVQEEEINAEFLDAHLVQHTSGVTILAAPHHPQDAEFVQAADVQSILDILKASFDCVIIDTPASFDEISLLVLEQSDITLVPVRRDVASIKNVKSGLDILESLELQGQTWFILNQANLHTGIELDDLERALGCRIAHAISSDEKNVINSVNQGVPLVLEQAGNELSKELGRLGKKVLQGYQPQPERETSRKKALGKIFSFQA